MLAISTVWNYKGRDDIEKMLWEIKSLGINNLELSYNLPQDKVEKIISRAKDMEMKIVSVHNFCPLIKEIKHSRHSSSYYLLTSLDSKERKLAVKYTKLSLDTARYAGAEVLIMHCGSVLLDEDLVKYLFQLYLKGKSSTSQYQKTKEEILKRRLKNRQPYWELLKEVLREIINYACRLNIKIGLETRYYPQEIPNIEEVGLLFEEFGTSTLKYWHDTGHAQVQERLGITQQSDFLRRYSQQLIGAHIHGIRGLSDHLAPFCGDFDLSKIMPYFSHKMIKVIEAHSKAKEAEIKTAVEKLI